MHGLGYGCPWHTNNHTLLLFLVVSLVPLMLLVVGEAEASEDPPSTGDWTVETWEDVVKDNATLDLSGDLHVRGSLTLDHSTLWVWLSSGGPRDLTVYPSGTLVLRTSEVGPSGIGVGYSFHADTGSQVVMRGSTFWKAGTALSGDGRTTGVSLATDASLVGVSFLECQVGLWVSGSTVTAVDCIFLDCRYGAVVSQGGWLDVSGASIRHCLRGVLNNNSRLSVGTTSFLECSEGAVSYAGSLVVSNSTFVNCSSAGVTGFSASVSLADCVLMDAEADGIVLTKGSGLVVKSVFDNLTRDLTAIHSTVTVKGTRHLDTFDEALWMYYSEFDVANVSTHGSYWALRARSSTGTCRGLRAVNATYGALLERCRDVLLEDVFVDGGFKRPDGTSSRGLVIVGGPVTVRNVTIVDVRNGMDLTSFVGTVEGANVTGCSREGVMLSLSWDYVLRDVNVTRAMDGFRMNLYNGGVLERCRAHRCRSAGFNYTAGSTTLLLGCNASFNPVGIGTLYSSPTLRNCTLYQCDECGVPSNITYGLMAYFSDPTITGSSVVGGLGGVYLNHSSGTVRNVTFLRVDRWCVEVVDSEGVLVEGCLITECPNATGVTTLASALEVVGNRILGTNYGITCYHHTSASIEDNLIEGTRWSSIYLLDHSAAQCRGNVIRSPGYHCYLLLLFSSLTSRDDLLVDTNESMVLSMQGSTLDMERCRFENSPAGMRVWDSPSIRISSCEFRNMGHGILIYKLKGDRSYTDRVVALVEGTYFTNHTSQCIYIQDGHLTVDDCSFLDNIGGIEALNSTVDILDCTVVGSWFHGLSADNSTVRWTVSDLARVISSDVIGRVEWSVEGGRLQIEDSLVDLDLLSSFRAEEGSSLELYGVTWRARESTFRAVSSEVLLGDCTFEGLGPLAGGTWRELGISVEDCQLVAVNCTFRRSRAGLSLEGGSARLEGCAFKDCSQHGVAATGATIDITGCKVERTVLGAAITVRESELTATDLEVTAARDGLLALGGTATLANCSLGGIQERPVHCSRGLVVLVNTTVHEREVSVEANGTIEVWWFLTGRVLWPNPAEVENATVWVDDVGDVEVARSSPDARGITSPMTVLSLVHTEEGVGDQGPHMVSVELQGYTAWVRVALNASMTVVLDLHDDDPPVIEVKNPPEAETWLGDRYVLVFGKAADAGSGTAEVEASLDGSPYVWRAKGGTFAFNITLTDGRHEVELLARDLAGNEATRSLVLWVESSKLVLSPPQPGDGSYTRERTVEVRGRISRSDQVTVLVNGERAEVDGANRTYGREVALVEGRNTVSVHASDVYGHRAWTNLTINADWTPPELVITSPLQVNTTEQWAEVTGWTDGSSWVTIQGSPVLLQDGAFSVRYPVYVCETLLVVRAEDAIGNYQEVEVLVFREEATVLPEGPSPWEVVPFLLGVPIMVVGVGLALRRRHQGGEGP